MHVCPDCKGVLTNLFCANCKVQFESKNGIPELLSRNDRFKVASEIGTTYDEIYTNRSQVWQDQGRTPEFIEFFSNLVARLSTGKLLEVGCGEGFLLSQLKANEKFAVDISGQALEKAKAKTGATCAVALAERLPFPDQTFDVVVSVGVMEHFLDDREATADIQRVLKRGGAYVALIHVEHTTKEKIQQKLAEYVFPRPRPIAGLRWLLTKVYKPIHQPIQRNYTIASGKSCVQQGGFTVKEVISTASHRGVPLIGPHVIIYVASKTA